MPDIVAKTKVASFIILYPRSEERTFSGREVDGIHFYPFSFDSNGRLSIVSAAGAILAPLSLPGAPFRVLFVDPQNEGTVEKAHELLQALSSVELQPPLFIPRGGPHDDISLATTEFIAAEYKTLCHEFVRTLKGLAELRARHENLQNDFAGLEAYVHNSGLGPCELLFENAPTGSLERTIGRSGVVSQLLPVSSASIAAVQLHTARGESDDSVSQLIYSLRSVEDRELLWRGSSNGAVSEAGWITIFFPSISGPVDRSVELVIESGAGNKPINLSVGHAQPIELFRARSMEGIRSKSSLALRCWAGLPGVALANIAEAEAKLGRHVAVRERRISAPFLMDFVHVLSRWQPEFIPVKFLNDEQAVECHPPPIGPTAGVLTLSEMADPFILNADCRVNGTQAQPIKFFMGLIPNKVHFDPAEYVEDVEALLDSCESNSGWLTLGAGEYSSLSVSCERPYGAARVIIATMMAKGQDNSFAWARFRNFTIRSAQSDLP